jgi:endogenous inhibitor of DNA gyrase (YacG/DUF329 family)
MPDPTNAARQRRWRERQAERLPPAVRVPCEACGTVHTGAHDPFCSRCWERLTVKGRAAKALRVRNSRARQQASPNAVTDALQ